MRVRLIPLLRSAITAALLASTALPAAAQATQAEADRLRAIGETYLGKRPAGEPPVVTVVPEGDHYRAGLDATVLVNDLLQLVPEAKRPKFRIEWAPMTMALGPQSDGLWRFWDYKIGKLVTEFDGQRSEVVTEGVDFTSIFDPATGATPNMVGRFGKMVATSQARKSIEDVAVSTEQTSTDVTFKGTTRPTGTPGVLDGDFSQITSAMVYAIGISGGGAKGVPDMRFALNTGRQDASVGIRGFRNAAILDLWAHLVAHHTREDFTAGQAALKSRIAAAAPLFEAAHQKVEAKDLAFESAFAIVNAEKMALDVDLAGITREGRFGLAIGLAGFQAYSMFMPKWANRLIPRDLALAGHVSGYDLATPLSVFLDSADFSAAKPLTPEQEAKIVALFLPRGAVDVNLDGNRIVGPLYDVTLDGRLKAGPDGAKGAVTVQARGLDKVAEHLAGPDGDERSKAAAGMVAVARGFAERKGDLHVWRFDFDGKAVSVNGKPLK